MKRGGALKRGKRIKPVSDKRRAEIELRRDVVMEVHARDRYCQAEKLWPEIACGGPLDVHEPNARSRNQGDWLDAAKSILICRQHHSAIHEHPRLARERGLLQ